MSDFDRHSDDAKRKAEKAGESASKWYHLNIPREYRPYFWAPLLFVLAVIVGTFLK